jgi:L-aspartate oxidase
MRTEADYLVVGSGLAGLLFAIKASRLGSVILLSKSDLDESNTSHAQGGIAAVVDPTDALDRHAADTMAAGDGLSDPEAVAMIVGQGPLLIAELEALGTRFTRDASGHMSLGREGGHSAARVVRADDLTGREVARALLATAQICPQVELRPRHQALDLLLDSSGACCGVRALETESERTVDLRAGAVMLATGGCGRIYQHTTNPAVATGDGLAMAYRAGAKLANMEFVQFHPTVLFHPEGDEFLISEAVRGYGGVLVSRSGEAFADARLPLGSLATRDVLTRAIVDEMQLSGEECVFLDVSHKEAEATRRRFPNIYQHCLSLGVDMTREPIPVVPAAHYMCGGVCTDLNGLTDVAGLYAAGETGMTGLHGANRLASNSLLEAAVMADRAAAQPAPPAARLPDRMPPVPQTASRPDPGLAVALQRRLRRRMWDSVGILRTDEGLAQAEADLGSLLTDAERLHARAPLEAGINELRSMATVANLVVRAARQRLESRGGHFSSDHPRRDDVHWQRPIYLQA